MGRDNRELQNAKCLLLQEREFGFKVAWLFLFLRLTTMKLKPPQYPQTLLSSFWYVQAMQLTTSPTVAGVHLDTKRTFEDVVSALFADVDLALTAADGYAERELNCVETDFGMPIPTRLREYYLLSGKAVFNQAFNRFLAPDEFERRGDKVVFCEQNQGVALWAFSVDDPDDDDPCVWQECNSAWEMQPDRMSVFLMKMFCWQAVMGGLSVFAQGEISNRTHERLEQTFDRVEYDSENEPRVFIRNRIIVCLYPMADGHRIYAGSNDGSDIEQLAESFDLDMI